MSVILALIQLIRAALAPLTNDDEAPSGAEAVTAAIYEMGDVTNGVYDACLGEPTIEANEGLFTADPKVVIPIENTKYGDAGSLVFDIPMGPEDAEAQFWNLLDAFDLALDELYQLEGLTVPVRYSGGNVIVMWDQIEVDEGDAAE